MTAMLLGQGGQVGTALLRRWRGEVIVPSLEELDLSQPETIRPYLQSLPHPPSLILNAAAYTAVDRAESEPERADAVNHRSPAELARWAAEQGAALLHYSTDYVYHGQGSAPFREDDADAYGPQNIYGRTKLAGDRAIAESGCRYLILRTSWVYGPVGQNFLKTMLRLGQERESLRIVADQIGSPTCAEDLAEVTLSLLPEWMARPETDGIYHACPPEVMSWHGFAEMIFAEARKQGMALNVTSVTPIASADYPTPAKRPLNSQLSVEKLQHTFGLRLPGVADAVRRTITSLGTV